jgi:hypothetical protein
MNIFAPIVIFSIYSIELELHDRKVYHMACRRVLPVSRWMVLPPS